MMAKRRRFLKIGGSKMRREGRAEARRVGWAGGEGWARKGARTRIASGLGGVQEGERGLKIVRCRCGAGSIRFREGRVKARLPPHQVCMAKAAAD
jgi:hypothetical protein